MNNLHNIHSNRGSALVMSMIFLLVLTIAGVTAMRFATLEEKMAANSQASAHVFQQAQSEIRTQLKHLATAAGRNQLNSLDYPTMPKEANSTTLKYMPETASQREYLAVASTETSTNLISNINDNRQIRFIRDGHCGDGSSIGKFICIDFEIEVEAELSNGVYSHQAQGFTFKNNVADGN